MPVVNAAVGIPGMGQAAVTLLAAVNTPPLAKEEARCTRLQCRAMGLARVVKVRKAEALKVRAQRAKHPPDKRAVLPGRKAPALVVPVQVRQAVLAVALKPAARKAVRHSNSARLARANKVADH